MSDLIGYARVSTREQGLKRNGLESQCRDIEAFAKDNGFKLLDIREEVVSAKYDDHKRVVLGGVITHAKVSGCAIVVSKLDRFSRSVAYVGTSMEAFKRDRVKFYCANLGVDVDPFMLHLYAALAEKERIDIGQRTKAGLASKRARGEPLGNHTTLHLARVKAGEVSKATANAYAASVRPLMLSLKERKLTLQAMADELNRYGTQTPRGGVWCAMSVRGVLIRLQLNTH